MESIARHVEALMFASEHGIALREIKDVLNELTKEGKILPDSFEADYEWTEKDVQDILIFIERRYDREESILELRKVAGAYQFLTKADYHVTVRKLMSQRSRKKLSQAAMETLAIIAYRQPITKLEIEHIRGVNCDYTIQRLLERELIVIQGKEDAPGRPLLYGTSPNLLEYFGLNDVSELPRLKEIVTDENTIGEASE